MKKTIQWLLVLILSLCLTAALAEEAITVGGIEDGVTVMDEGFLHLDFSGMEEGKLYRGTLSFTNANGVAREEYCAFSTPEEAYLSVAMASAPGEYGPFTLTLTCEGETVGQWTFMGQVPEGEILVDSSWSSWNDDYQPSMSYVAAIPGDGQATCANTASIQLKGPLDGSVMLGQPGYSLDVRWEMQQPGRYLLYLVDAQDGSIVWEDFYEAQDSEWIGYSIHPELTSGKMYQFVAVYGQEAAYTNFFVMDESAWNGVNPWDAVASAPDLQLPDSVLASAVQDTLQVGQQPEDTLMRVTGLEDFMMERYRPYEPMAGVEDGSRAFSMEDGTIFYINMPSQETDQLMRPHVVSILSGDVSQPEATSDGLYRAVAEHIPLLMDLSLALTQRQEQTALPINLSLLLQLIEAKSINTWTVHEAALMDADVADGWQLVFFSMAAADGSLYNGEVYLFAQRYIRYAIGESEELGSAPYRIVITDQAQVEEVLEYCLFNLASTSQEQMDTLTVLYDEMR